MIENAQHDNLKKKKKKSHIKLHYCELPEEPQGYEKIFI